MWLHTKLEAVIEEAGLNRSTEQISETTNTWWNMNTNIKTHRLQTNTNYEFFLFHAEGDEDVLATSCHQHNLLIFPHWFIGEAVGCKAVCSCAPTVGYMSLNSKPFMRFIKDNNWAITDTSCHWDLSVFVTCLGSFLCFSSLISMLVF